MQSAEEKLDQALDVEAMVEGRSIGQSERNGGGVKACASPAGSIVGIGALL